jgi:putative acetyltransferase
LYIFETDGIRKGMFKLIPQKHRNSHILYLGGVAIEPASSGKGLGRQMIEELTDLAVGSGYTRIELTVATSNQRAIHLYESCGFVNEGILRNYTYLKSEGRYIDEQVMALLLQA